MTTHWSIKKIHQNKRKLLPSSKKIVLPWTVITKFARKIKWKLFFGKVNEKKNLAPFFLTPSESLMLLFNYISLHCPLFSACRAGLRWIVPSRCLLINMFGFFKLFKLISMLPIQKFIFCFENCSDIHTERKKCSRGEIQGWRPRRCKIFEITRKKIFIQ